MGLSLVTERTEAGVPVVDAEDDESIAHIQPDVGIVLGEGHVEGPGTLYVTTRWVATMHSVSRLKFHLLCALYCDRPGVSPFFVV